MPLVRKIIYTGRTSRAIIIPKGWIEYYEKQQGSPIDSVTIEVNRVLRIEPILTDKNKTEIQVQKAD